MAGGEFLKKLDDLTKDAFNIQLQTLHTILQRNGCSSYLQKYGGSFDTTSFREAVPLSCYDDYSDYIARMADGGGDQDDDRPLLSVDPLVCFFNSSGTSSMKPKLVPYFDSPPSKAASQFAHQGRAAILGRLFPPRQSINKVLSFIYAGNVSYTKGGFRAMAASAFLLHSSNNKNPSPFFSVCVSPREVILGSNLEQQLYCHILCGLRNFEIIDGIRAPYAVGLIRAFALLESKWEQICDDLECGLPSLEISDVEMRDSIVEILDGPQLYLSKKMRSICEGKDWGGIVRKLWPNVRYIKCVTTGSMQQYYQKLKYYAGEIPVLGGDYFSSECCVAINLDIMQPPHLTRYVMLPNAAYFEFLPFDLDEMSVVGEETVDFSGVAVGRMYEVVVTTYRGLFRYRLGDIVRVVGFYYASPEVEFVMRAPKTPNEILTERNLMTAMENFQLVLRKTMMAEVTEFASFLDLELSPKQLKLFVEVNVFLQNEKLQDLASLLRRSCSSLEDGLGGVYKLRRERGEVGPLLVSIVKQGSFNGLLQMATENGAPASQYKPPKIIRNLEIVNFMERSTLVAVSLDSSDS